jgi:hypothetical protein
MKHWTDMYEYMTLGIRWLGVPEIGITMGCLGTTQM